MDIHSRLTVVASSDAGFGLAFSLARPKSARTAAPPHTGSYPASALCLSSSIIGVLTEGKRAFFDSSLLDITGNNTKNARLRGEMENFFLCRVAYYKRPLPKLHPWAGACSPEGSLRRDKENVRPEPASKNATTDKLTEGLYAPIHGWLFRNAVCSK